MRLIYKTNSTTNIFPVRTTATLN